MNEHLPVCVVLQETLLKPSCTSNIRGYSIPRKDCNTGERACGGVALLINHTTPFSPVLIRTTPRTYRSIPITIHSLGDFNAHNLLWSSQDVNSRGKVVEKLFTELDLTLLNDGSNTYFHSPTQSFSAIDLSICSPSLLLNLTWSVLDNPLGSDHFPVVISYATPIACATIRQPRWKFDQADWETFRTQADITEDMVSSGSIDEETPPFFPNLGGTKNAKWQKRIKTRLGFGFDVTLPPDNMIAFNKARARARKVHRQRKRETWIKYVSNITCSTSSKEVWNKIRKLSGKYSASLVSMLVSNGVSVNTIPDIAKTLSETFAKTSSCDNYTPAFQALKRREERVKLNFSSSNEEGYNSPLTLRELRASLHRSGNTAGPDGLHYIMLRHLSESSILSLLLLFNRIWETHVFPTQWCHAHVLPFPKPGKDPTSAINYRPIALTSCLSKLMERMVSARLMFHLESHNLLSPLQSGFRKSRSTTDNLLRLETSIREAFVKKQYNISVFFDIKKAYDMSWRYGILRDLYAMDIRGNLPVFIKNFLNNRSFQVRLLSFYSNIFIQEQGVPQGSVLSALLFIIKINSITHHINQGIQCSLYVDDVQISYSSKFLNVAQRHIQTTINNFTKWAEQNGFVFSTEKTVSVVFTRKRGVFPNPELFIGRSIIKVVNEVKFLGLIFDQSLRFHRHLKDLKIRSANALNILKVLANTHWGADRTSLLRLYRALIRSKLDYGSVVYSSACKSLLKILDPVHHQALRLCLGAFRTSPVESLYAEAYEPH
ncbi:probable RNA-directed DNA polymerase from transposon X-element [Trichonephila clavipes]|nr:probable RNA-directed DNA polymerase from transposon X-element [Trichonephila clavipes]